MAIRTAPPSRVRRRCDSCLKTRMCAWVVAPWGKLWACRKCYKLHDMRNRDRKVD